MTSSPKQVLPYGLALLSGFLLALSFPDTNLYPLAWFAFIPLFFAIRSQNPPKAFLLAWLTALVYFCGTLYWVTISLQFYGGISPFVSTLVMLLLVAYLSLYLGLFAWILQYISKEHEKGLLLFAPALWVVLEWLKGHLLTGFPWASLAYSQSDFLPMIQIADFGSLYSVGFVMMLVNRALYLTILKKIDHSFFIQSISWKSIAFALSIFFCALFYGFFRLSQPMTNGETIRVSVIQGNIAQNQKWDQAFKDQTTQTYVDLSLSTLKNNGNRPDLIVWPEAATPFIFGTEHATEALFQEFVHDKKVHLLFGSPSLESRPSGEIRLHNSAFLLSPEQVDISQYDKLHLVPFGEYIPMPNLLFFIDKLVQDIGDFFPGTQATVFEIENKKIGTVICFEVIFPELVRRFVQNGASLMTTLSNDAWFGTSSAPTQHFSMVVFRAVENRVPFARAANTGISGFIDAQGHILHQSNLFVEATATSTLSLRQTETLYSQFGDFFAGFCAMITAILLLRSHFKRRIRDAL